MLRINPSAEEISQIGKGGYPRLKFAWRQPELHISVPSELND
jgi:hypothetical protein